MLSFSVTSPALAQAPCAAKYHGSHQGNAPRSRSELKPGPAFLSFLLPLLCVACCAPAMKSVLDADSLKRDLQAKLQRLVQEERIAQHRANVDDQPATLRPLEVGEVLHDDMPNVLPKWMREGLRPRVAATMAAPGALEEQDNFSLGTRGHPNKCKPACRFHRRRGGCREGASCKFCHECIFSDSDPNYLGVPLHSLGPASSTPVPPGAMQRPSSEGDYPSIGSIGHPFSCGAPCKYNSKPKGCKDGLLCDHCHLCRWKRHTTGAGPVPGGRPNLEKEETLFA
ncbi:unnamed protein product [Symbiodinium sp. CCMP2592]|nr:unnamed protein product [Symbiodinium sp. CCMP2592]